MSVKTETYQYQNRLAEYCRSGKLNDALPLSREEALPQYRRLVFNVVKNTLEQAFPITQQVLTNEQWDELLFRFFLEHDCQTPQVWKLPAELCSYVMENQISEELELPWLDELLWFEWLEIEVHTMPDIDAGSVSNEGSLLNDIPVLNPEYRLEKLSYPFHLFPVKEAAEKRGEYFVLLYREPESEKVHFMALATIHAYFIEQLSAGEQTIEELIRDTAEKIPDALPESLMQKAIPFFEELLNNRVILGFRPNENAN